MMTSIRGHMHTFTSINLTFKTNKHTNRQVVILAARRFFTTLSKMSLVILGSNISISKDVSHSQLGQLVVLFEKDIKITEELFD